MALSYVGLADAADVCDPRVLTGPYVFQMAGSTTISGTPQPAVSLGRIVFDGSGKITGTSSVTFSGVLLGNPVTGTYEAHPDCSVTWKLQDDSGAYQNFSGKVTQEGRRVQFTESGTGGLHGSMQKTADSCSSADLRRRYNYVASGDTKAMQPGQEAHSVSAKGQVDTAWNNSFKIDGDCSVHFTLTLPPPSGEASEQPPIHARGFIVNGGKEILGFQTDPGAMVSLHLTEAP
jgi:hypothetical protein